MSLIKETQLNILLDEAAQFALLNNDLVLIRDYFQSFTSLNNQFDSLINSLPLFSLYTAVHGRVISIKDLRILFQNVERDIKTLNHSYEQLNKSTQEYLSDTFYRTSLANKLSEHISQSAIREKNRLASKASSALRESFLDLSNINIPLTDLNIDTGVGTVTLKHQTEQVLLDVLASKNNLVVPSAINTTPQSCIDNNLKTAWMAYFTKDTDYIEAVFDCKGAVTTITLNPIGFGVNVQGLIETDTDKVEFTEVLYSKKRLELNVENAKTLTIRVSTVSETLPKAIGLSEIVVEKLNYVETGTLYTVTQSIPSFNEIKLNDNITDDTASFISWYVRINSGNWIKLVKNKWQSLSNIGSNKVDLLPEDLNTDSSLFVSDTQDIPATIGSGTMQIGDNQLLVQAQRKFTLEEGEPFKNLSSSLFRPMGEAWAGDLPITTSSDPSTVCPVQLQNDSTEHAVLVQNKALVGSQITPNGSGLTWLMSNTNSSVQKDYHYKFSCRVYVEETIVVSNGLYWFIQGFKEPGSKTFRQNKKSLGSFAVYVNNIPVAGDIYADTLFSDFTCESKAESGHTYSFVLNEGWNTVEYHLYSPNLPPYLKDEESLSDYLQLTIYPNLLDNNIQNQLKITKTLSVDPIPPINIFDLTWKTPKSLRYWAWSEVNPGRITFNTNASTKIDKFYGGENSFSLPNITIYYTSRVNSNNVNIELKAEMVKTDKGKSPMLNFYEVLTK